MSTLPSQPTSARLDIESPALHEGAAQRLLVTTMIVSLLATGAVGVAYDELRAAESAFAVDDVMLGEPWPVSRYSVRAVGEERVAVRFWRGTSLEYGVVATAGEREQRIVDLAALPNGERMRRAEWSRVGDVVVIDGVRWHWSTFKESCGEGALLDTMISWRLCRFGGTRDETCVVAPASNACWSGPLEIADVLTSGERNETLWVVVERQLANRTSRMIAGVRRD